MRLFRLLVIAWLALYAVAAAAPPPNILLIISDDQAWTDYGFMGHPHLRTPQLDRLAAESRWFPHGYVPASLCSPSLVSILTGRFPHEHRVTGNDPPLPAGLTGAARYRAPEFAAGRERLAAFVGTLPTLSGRLHDAGYLTLQTGKWWLRDPRRFGFTHAMTHGDEARGGRHGDAGLTIGREGLEPVREFLDEAAGADRPWFIWYAPFLPHDPHTPPEHLLAKYRALTPSIHVARYWAMVEWFDETVGELLAELDRRGQAADTLVAYVTDNGWIQSPDSPRYAPRSKQSPYDGGLRTPILLRWPGRIAPARIEAPVSSVDLLPTLLRAAGVTPPAGLPGVDLRDDRAVRRRRAVPGACFTHDLADFDDPVRSLRWRWIVRDGWKLILPHPANEPAERTELYRLRDDPFEERNLADAEPRRVRDLTRQLDRWWPAAE